MCYQKQVLILNPRCILYNCLRKLLGVLQMVFGKARLSVIWQVHVDVGKLDNAIDCYTNALNIKHTRAHQDLACVYHLKDQRKLAYDEMTKLIEKAKYNASAYEKRSEYCDHEMTKSDLSMATKLYPLRTYTYRYQAAGNLPWFILVPSYLSTE